MISHSSNVSYKTLIMAGEIFKTGLSLAWLWLGPKVIFKAQTLNPSLSGKLHI